MFVGRGAPAGGRFRLGGEAHFEALDVLDQLSRGLVNIATQEDATVDEILDAILDDIETVYGVDQVPSGDRDFETALESPSYFTCHNRNPLNAMKLAVKQELGANDLFRLEGRQGDVLQPGAPLRGGDLRDPR